MKIIAKAVIRDEKGQYLLMQRSDHPTFPNEPDLPGGIVEKGEAPVEGLVREIQEEAGIDVDPADLVETYAGRKFSRHFNMYHLFEVTLSSRPEVVISWEHASYEWVSRDEFIERSRASKDTFLNMTAAVLSGEVKEKSSPSGV